MRLPPDATVFVVDDDEGARESVCALVQSMGLAALGYGSAEEFLDSGLRFQPGCLVTDLRMMGMNGLELQEELRGDENPLPVVVITAFAETNTTVRAMRGGAVNLLEKPCSEQMLWDAIREAICIDAAGRQQAAQRRELIRRLETLTAQERKVMELMMTGLPNKAIAAELDVSLRTIESRRRNVFRKLGASSLPDLVRLVISSRPAA